MSRARVDVEPGHLRLLGAHVRRRADHLAELGEERLVGELAVGRLGDAEVDDLRHRHAVVQRHEHVGGLDVAVDDALLVGVLDRVADLDEELEARPGVSRCLRRSTR